MLLVFFFSSGRRHTRFDCDWSSDVCSSDLSLRFGSPFRHGRFSKRESHSARNRTPKCSCASTNEKARNACTTSMASGPLLFGTVNGKSSFFPATGSGSGRFSTPFPMGRSFLHPKSNLFFLFPAYPEKSIPSLSIKSLRFGSPFLHGRFSKMYWSFLPETL